MDRWLAEPSSSFGQTPCGETWTSSLWICRRAHPARASDGDAIFTDEWGSIGHLSPGPGWHGGTQSCKHGTPVGDFHLGPG